MMYSICFFEEKNIHGPFKGVVQGWNHRGKMQQKYINTEFLSKFLQKYAKLSLNLLKFTF